MPLDMVRTTLRLTPLNRDQHWNLHTCHLHAIALEFAHASCIAQRWLGSSLLTAILETYLLPRHDA